MATSFEEAVARISQRRDGLLSLRLIGTSEQKPVFSTSIHILAEVLRSRDMPFDIIPDYVSAPDADEVAQVMHTGIRAGLSFSLIAERLDMPYWANVNNNPRRERFDEPSPTLPLRNDVQDLHIFTPPAQTAISTSTASGRAIKRERSESVDYEAPDSATPSKRRKGQGSASRASSRYAVPGRRQISQATNDIADNAANPATDEVTAAGVTLSAAIEPLAAPSTEPSTPARTRQPFHPPSFRRAAQLLRTPDRVSPFLLSSSAPRMSAAPSTPSNVSASQPSTPVTARTDLTKLSEEEELRSLQQSPYIVDAVSSPARRMTLCTLVEHFPDTQPVQSSNGSTTQLTESSDNVDTIAAMFQLALRRHDTVIQERALRLRRTLVEALEKAMIPSRAAHPISDALIMNRVLQEDVDFSNHRSIDRTLSILFDLAAYNSMVHRNSYDVLAWRGRIAAQHSFWQMIFHQSLLLKAACSSPL